MAHEHFAAYQQSLVERRATLLTSDNGAKEDVLGAIDRALARIADGSFGNCIGCAEPISKSRLNALPWAERCRACQNRLELEQLPGEAPAFVLAVA